MQILRGNRPQPARHIITWVVLFVACFGQYVHAQSTGVRRQFMGMHNLKDGGPEIRIGMDWTKTLTGSTGFVFDWVFDYAPTTEVNWVGEAMKRDLIPCVRVQECASGCTPSASYAANVASQIVGWKLLHPEYANRIVYMQLWNEPGDPRDYVPMTVYADYLAAAYSAIHQVEDNAAATYPSLGFEGTFKVMTPGQNGPSGWEEAFQHNPSAKYAFDVWATHPYPEATPPWHNIHDGDEPPGTTKAIDSYLADIDVVARTHGGVPGRRGFPVMITETAYGEYLGISYEGWPKTSRQMAADYNVDAFFSRWYQWPEIVAVHPFILANWSWDHFAWVDKGSGSTDSEAPFGVLEPTNPYPQYTAVKAERERFESLGLLAPAQLTPYRGAVGTIAGAITRSDNGDVVPYATLYTDGYEFGHVSMFDGLYEIHDVPVGTYTLSFQKVGYAPASRQITVTQNQTTTADFSVIYVGKVQHRLYWIDTFAGNSGCNSCSLSHPYHTQSFMTGPDTGFIKFASCKPNIDGVTMKFTIHADGPTGPQIGVPAYGTLEPGVGGIMIGGEWPDGQEPAVEPNTKYWLRFETHTGQAVYCYAAGDNPYSGGESGANGGWDYYGYIKGMTQAVNLATGDVAGTVLDDSSNPIEGAIVSTGSGSDLTDSNGSYRISDVPIGSTTVNATKLGYSNETQIGVLVQENQTTTVNFVLSPGPTTGSIVGTISDATNGGTLTGATVQTTAGNYSTTSTTNGAFALNDVVGGTYTVQVSKDGYLTEQRTNIAVTPGQVSTVNVALSEVAPFAGLINGNFEGGAFDDPNGDHRTANSWHQFITSGFSKSTVSWLGSGAHSMNYVQEFYEALHVSGIYQQVGNADVGGEYKGTVWVKATDNAVSFQIGIDPAGGTSATSGNIVWGNSVAPGMVWTICSVQAEATSSTITLFVKVQNSSGANENGFIDDATLVYVGVIEPPVPVTWGDDDSDGDIDQSDFGALQACLTGATRTVQPGAATPQGHSCKMFDANGDLDVDDDDVTYFATCMSGANVAADCETEEPYPPMP